MTIPHKFQAECVREINYLKGRAIVACDPGLGKTLMALLYCKWKVKGPIVVICPADSKIHWAREAQKHIGRRVEILNGMTPNQELTKGNKIWVLNYDILGIPRPGKPTWVSQLKKIKPEIIICDECHFLKNPAAKRSRGTKILCHRTPKILMLSGTPLVSRPMELWFQVHIVNPNLFPSRHEYGVAYCDGHLGGFGWDYSGASNLKRLHKILMNEVMVRRKKEEVLKELPPKIRTVMPVVIPKPQMSDYYKAVKDFLVWLEERDPAAAKRAITAERIVQLGYLKRLAAQGKIPIVNRIIESFLNDSRQKLLVFAIHTKFIQALKSKFKNDCIVVDGSIPTDKRQALYDKFNKSKNCPLLVGNLQAAGVVWSCTSSSTVYFAEMGWRPGDHIQAADRVRGINRGTGVPVDERWIVAEDTIEVDLCKILQEKQKVLTSVLDGRNIKELDIYTQLENAMVARHGNGRKRRNSP